MDSLNIAKGQIVLLELEDECVIGEILHVGAKRSFVRLKNVRDFQSNQPIQGNQDYYNAEIRNVKIIEDCVQVDSLSTNAGNSVVSSAAAESIARIHLEEVEDIFAKIESHTFIHQTDIKYHDAIKYLKTQKRIAIAMEGVRGGRHTVAPSLLSIATPEAIYVFDIMWMKVTNDLRTILANPRVRRVAHNVRLMADVLKHRFTAPLGKCFDTLVAHISTNKDYNDHDELSMQECLSKYLNLPNNFFDTSVTFENRPLNDSQRKAAAKNVAFLLTLEDYFVHEIMLEPFYRSCEQYGTSLAGQPEHAASIIKLSKGRNEDLHEISQFKLNILSKESEEDSDDTFDQS